METLGLCHSGVSILDASRIIYSIDIKHSTHWKKSTGITSTIPMHDLQLQDQDQGHFMDKNVEKLYKNLFGACIRGLRETENIS